MRKINVKNMVSLALIALLTVSGLLSFFSMVKEPVKADVGQISSAETVSGNIATSGQMDSYTFSGEAGQGVVIEMAAASGSNLGPAVYLYRPNGSLETKIIGGYDSTRIRIEDHQLELTGTYTIVTSASGASSTSTTGAYGLSLVLIPGATQSGQDADGGSIVSGQTISGNISLRSDTDAFTFNGEAGQVIVIEMAAASGSNLGPSVYLYRPNGRLETKTIGGYDSTRIRIEDHQLEQTGIYTIVTSASWASSTSTTGAYGLSLVLIGGNSSPPVATPTSTPTPTPISNEIFYEDFESGDLQNWEVSSNGQVPFTVSTEDQHSGMYSLKIGPSSCSASCFDNYRISLTLIDGSFPDGQYTISYWRRETNDWGGHFTVLINGNSIGDDFGLYNNEHQDSGWYQNSFSYNGTIDDFVIGELDLTSAEAIYLDDITITYTGQSSPQTPTPTATPTSTPTTPPSLWPPQGREMNPEDVIFEWPSVSGATGYQVQVSIDPDFEYLVVDENLGNVQSYQPTTPFDYNSTYYWRVRALGAASEDDWNSSYFTTSPPEDNSFSFSSLPNWAIWAIGGGFFVLILILIVVLILRR